MDLTIRSNFKSAASLRIGLNEWKLIRHSVLIDTAIEPIKKWAGPRAKDCKKKGKGKSKRKSLPFETLT